MELLYFPGCTLKTSAKNFEDSALTVASKLGLELRELPRWNCCGTVYSLAADDLMHQLAPVRNLVRVQELNRDKLVTLCSMCYNTLKRASRLVRRNSEKLETINMFMDEEQSYEGRVEVFHFLQTLRDEVGFKKISEKVVKPLKDLKIFPYYGCLLVRPEEEAIDDPNDPTVMNDLLKSLGAEVIDNSFKTVCCGSYLTVDKKEVVAEMTYKILSAAVKDGAEAVTLSCPLCHFNLDFRQAEVAEKHPEFKRIPVFYFTQLMALAFGLNPEVCRFNLHFVDPKPLLRGKGFI